MALGLAVMILSVAIVVGFKKEVRNKVIGFGSHIQITNFNNNTTYETHPITISDSLLAAMQAQPNIHHIQPFATLPAIIKTDSEHQGVVMKGVDSQYDWQFLHDNLVEGTVLTLGADASKGSSTEVLLSKTLSDKLNLKVGDSFQAYFIQEPVRARKYSIAGIYQTNFEDFDKLYIIGDIAQVRRLHGWDEDMISGLEITVNDYEQLDATAESLYYDLSTQTDRLGNHYYTRSIKDVQPMIFAWLDVLDMNVVVILFLMLLVAGFSMISGLLIIILEHANMIGILKALGENNTHIREIFLFVSAFLIGKGLLWGNGIALCICAVQYYTGILQLDPTQYYLSAVPIDISPLTWLYINFGTLFATLALLVIPSYIVAKISPAKTIRFE
jgi:lipoprotein-releasing system permease protein